MSGLGLRFAARSPRAARIASAASSCRVQSRALHRRKPLPYPVEEGLGTFLPPHALKVISEDYQQGLLDRLNDQIRGTSLENKSLVQTIINAAQDPNKVLEFNYATEALNNSFFLESLKPPPPADPSSTDPPARSHEAVLYHASSNPLLRRIHLDYGSLAQFQSSFSAAVLGMFSSGWVWLVTDHRGRLGIVPTFSTGTLLVAARKESRSLSEWQRLSGAPTIPFDEPPVLDPSLPTAPGAAPPSPSLAGSAHGSAAFTPTSPVSGVSHGAPPLDPHTPARSMHYQTPRGTYTEPDGLSDVPLGTTDMLYPLLCVSVHEHAWVSAGFGVWGKEEYMKRFWSVVDWQKVSKLYSHIKSTTS